MNTQALILAAALLATLPPSKPPSARLTEFIELSRERTTECCESEAVYLSNQLEHGALVATVAIDRPSLLLDESEEPQFALAEVLVGPGERVLVGTRCPGRDCAHPAGIRDFQLVEARLHAPETAADCL